MYDNILYFWDSILGSEILVSFHLLEVLIEQFWGNVVFDGDFNPFHVYFAFVFSHLWSRKHRLGFDIIFTDMN